MNWINCIFVALCCLFGVLASIRQMQMLQLNSYFAIRYLRWYKGVFKAAKAIITFISILLSVAVGFAAVNLPIHSAVSALLFLVVIALTSLHKNKTSIKPLVLTARVKRMLISEAVVLIILATLAVFTKGVASCVCAGILFLLSALPELLVLLSLFIMKPIEKAISNYYVNDAKKILASMKNLKIIGVTGSYGKTSTKFILGRILSEKYNTLVTPENYNTPMGVVITVRRDLRPQTEIFIVEMGAKRKGDIKEICDIANPQSGIITSVGPQHLDTFGNIETVVSTKFELADRVKENGGKIYLNTDNELIRKNKDDYPAVTYGTDNCDCKATDISYSPLGLTATIEKGDVSFKVTSKLLGTHNALNIAAAAGVALDLGLTKEEIAFAVSKLKPIEHRLELKPYINGSTLIDDAYNSNPEGCLEAVRVLGSFSDMKKIIVTPGLVELGEKEYECNKRLGQEAAKYCDKIILVGKNRSIPLKEGALGEGFNPDNLYVVSSFSEAVKTFSSMCDKNTVILFENDLPDNYLN